MITRRQGGNDEVGHADIRTVSTNQESANVVLTYPFSECITPRFTVDGPDETIDAILSDHRDLFFIQ